MAWRHESRILGPIQPCFLVYLITAEGADTVEQHIAIDLIPSSGPTAVEGAIGLDGEVVTGGEVVSHLCREKERAAGSRENEAEEKLASFFELGSTQRCFGSLNYVRTFRFAIH